MRFMFPAYMESEKAGNVAIEGVSARYWRGGGTEVLEVSHAHVQAALFATPRLNLAVQSLLRHCPAELHPSSLKACFSHSVITHH
jgi:hypothetical protein